MILKINWLRNTFARFFRQKLLRRSNGGETFPFPCTTLYSVQKRGLIWVTLFEPHFCTRNIIILSCTSNNHLLHQKPFRKQHRLLIRRNIGLPIDFSFPDDCEIDFISQGESRRALAYRFLDRDTGRFEFQYWNQSIKTSVKMSSLWLIYQARCRWNLRLEGRCK